MSERDQIIYTLTDEAPALATYSLLPVIQAFSKQAGVKVEFRDISLAGRIIARFPEFLAEEQRIPDALKELGALTQHPEANIIKLPNISASLPQLKRAIKELQEKGYALPDYPGRPANEEERSIKKRYDAIKGSAVNPVLREGNSDRRAPRAVKEYAQSHPHRMGEWSSKSKSTVASMREGDFYGSEISRTMAGASKVSIVLESPEGQQKTLKKALKLEAGEIIDASFMSRRALKNYLAEEKAKARQEGVLFSLHLKATMMKVSDPIIFGHAVESYFENLFGEFGEELNEASANPRSGFAQVLRSLKKLPEERQKAMQWAIEKDLDEGPDLAMVDSDKGITNLHVPSDVIIDASMPAMIRNGGKMWNKNDETQDTRALIPDRSYAGLYEETMAFCKKHGAFDPRSMGSVSNVGLMAQKAEEYGSHNKTYEIPFAGEISVFDEGGEKLMSHAVEEGDIWRLCQVKDEAVRNWIGLAVERARDTKVPAVFWLDEERAHDIELLKKVQHYLPGHDTEGLEFHYLAPREATRFTLERTRAGKDTISVTGNVLRDYLTDLFPILELGTSAKMLSIVPLMKGGGLFETGAGGSAPKHVQQLMKENHLRWDSLGEFLALAASLEHLARRTDNPQARLLAKTLDQATASYLKEGRSPSRKVGEPDNRNSHFYLALYWAEAMAAQDEDTRLKEVFEEAAEKLRAQETAIVAELNEGQGEPVELKGYFLPEADLAEAIMRPNERFNAIIDRLRA